MARETDWERSQSATRGSRVQLSKVPELERAERLPPTSEQLPRLIEIARQRRLAQRGGAASLLLYIAQIGLRALNWHLPASLLLGITAVALVLAFIAVFEALRVALVRCPRCEHRFYISPVRLFLGINLLWYSRCAHCGLDLAYARTEPAAI
jgi:hypothetical protein